MPASVDPSPAKILIVDDQESNVRLLGHVMRMGGYSAVTSTTDAREVCALHRENHYDLILLDLQMPHMSGFEVLEALRNEAPVPVLVLSADPAQLVRSLEAGAAAFMSKPFVLNDILLGVKALLPVTVPVVVEPPPRQKRGPGKVAA